MNNTLRPVFIVGAPRSGTTWLLSLLGSHSQCLAITPEDVGITPSRPTKETGVFLRGLSSLEIVDRFRDLPNDRIPIEKTPGHLLQVGRIKRIFPSCRIVLVQRSVQDVIWSMIQDNSFWADSPKDIRQAIELYNRYSRAQEIYSDYDAVVSYEDLWSKPVEELERLLVTLELEPEQASSLVEKNDKGRSLPAELNGVFRKGTPGEGSVNLSHADQEYLRAHLRISERRPRQLSILLATNHLFGWTGSETLFVTLIESLIHCGCNVTVYTRYWNAEWLDKCFDSRVRLTNDLASVKRLNFDLAHVQHNSCLVDVRAEFPRLPIIFSSLGVLPFLEQPVPFDLGVAHYFAVSEEVSHNLVAHGVASEKITIIRNMVSSDWFFPMSEIGLRPDRILVLSYKMDDEKKQLLREAAELIGSSIRFVGGKDGVVDHGRLCELINSADVVVTLGRGVVETMLCGRVPLVFDVHGGDGLVTPDIVQELWECNFSGRCHAFKYTAEQLVEELSKYRPEMGAALREVALANFGAKQNVERLVDIYEDVLSGAKINDLPGAIQPVLSYFSRLAREDIQQVERGRESELYLLAEIARVKGTFSWRVTGPLRALHGMISRLRRTCRKNTDG